MTVLWLRAARVVPGLVVLLLSGGVLADGGAPLVGSWQGGGRACNGRLDISRQKLSWKSSFSRCMNLGYRAEVQAPQGGLQRTVFQLVSPRQGCLHALIELRRTEGAAGAEPGWEAVGYPDRDSWLKGDMSQATACPLVRLK